MKYASYFNSEIKCASDVRNLRKVVLVCSAGLRPSRPLGTLGGGGGLHILNQASRTGNWASLPGTDPKGTIVCCGADRRELGGP